MRVLHLDGKAFGSQFLVPSPGKPVPIQTKSEKEQTKTKKTEKMVHHSILTQTKTRKKENIEAACSPSNGSANVTEMNRKDKEDRNEISSHI